MPTGLCRLPHHCDHTCLTKDAHTPHMLTLICLEHPQSHIHKLTCTWRIAYMFTHKIHKHTCSLLSVCTCMRVTHPCLYIRTFSYVPFTHLHTHLNLHIYPYTLTILTCIHMCTCSLIHACLHTHTLTMITYTHPCIFAHLYRTAYTLIHCCTHTRTLASSPILKHTNYAKVSHSPNMACSICTTTCTTVL